MNEKEKSLPNRKTTRLPNYDYSKPGAYFITICTKERRCILSEIVGTDVPGGPKILLTAYGKIADKHIQAMNDFYTTISVDKYVIMPNHIHLLIQINPEENGPPRTSVPTRESIISRFVSTFKRFCNKEYGENIWQYRSYDHVIRNREDYENRMKYIHENPLKWYYDELYSKRY